MTDNGATSGDQAREQKAAADKAVADARAAQAAADQADAQYAEWSSSLSRQQREAQARQAIAQADQATAAAQQAQISALIPDFSKVTPNTTTIQGTQPQPLFGSALARLALEKTMKAVADEINGLVKDRKTSLLLTASADLATSDAAYGEVVGGLQELTAAADAILTAAAPQPRPPGSKFLPAAAVIGAVAGAVPPLLSLLAPQRTLSSFAISPDTTAATSLLAGYLTRAGLAVQIDDFRPVPQGQVHTLEAALREKRTELVRKKVGRDGDRIKADNDRASNQTEVDRLTKTLGDLSPDDPKYDNLHAELQSATAARDASADATAQAADDVGVMTDLQTSIDTFLTAIHTVPANGNRSAYTLASLRQDLHDGTAIRVVYVSASGGSSDELLQHRFLVKDRFETIASVSVSYWVLDPGTGTIVAAGNAGGTSQLTGKIGDRITIETIDGQDR